MRPILPIIILSCLFLLTGCKKDSVIEVPIVSTKAKLSIADPEPLKLGKVSWIVVTEANWEAVKNKIKGKGEVVVLYALDGKNFKTLKANDGDVIRYVTKIRSNIKLYKNYYEGGK